MDRAAKLAEYARGHLDKERVEKHHALSRDLTRDCLARRAEELGFSSLEISAAVDTALKDAGTVP